MRYGILGEDGLSLAEKLAKYSGEVAWEGLREHFRNGVLFYVDGGLQLEEVGAALAGDERERVEEWLKRADLVKIEEIHARQWEGKEVIFEAVVVSPFVLCRPK